MNGIWISSIWFIPAFNLYLDLHFILPFILWFNYFYVSYSFKSIFSAEVPNSLSLPVLQYRIQDFYVPPAGNKMTL